MTTWKRLRALALRALHAWEWATIRAIEEWCETFLRAWRTGDGRPREVEAPRLPAALPVAPVAPVVDASPRRGEVGLRTPPREDTRPLLDRAAQPRMGVEQVTAGLKRLGFGAEKAKAIAPRAVAAGGEPGEIMRRALKMAQDA